ncbi:hypothetical protein EAF04_002453 [Stromatinia cepivora]|nr:hypothetical protein EAF04_002453 [Stromatinia cepivora]
MSNKPSQEPFSLAENSHIADSNVKNRKTKTLSSSLQVTAGYKLQKHDFEEGDGSTNEQDQLNVIIDIDEKFYQLDFRDESEQRSVEYELFIHDFTPEEPEELRNTSTVLGEYLKENSEDEDKVSYWKNVKVMPALRARPNPAMTQMRVMEVDAFIPFDANGNLTYKNKVKSTEPENSTD